MANQRNDATASAQGITFQFLVALECCFKMKPNEKVYIEKFGDVTVESISNNIQIEVKRRSDTLTKGSIEIWNTFYNWLQDGADWQQYSSLVFMTTQRCSPSSIWHKWNTISVAERIAEFRKLLNQKSGQLREIKEHVVNCLNSETLLKQFVERIYIASVDKSSDFWIKQLSPYSKSIPEQNKLVFYNSLLGFILQNGVFEKNGWEITNEEFSAEVKSISELLIDTSIKFPKVQYNLGELENYKEMGFTEKLREIGLDSPDDIIEAASEYVCAMNFNAEHLSALHRQGTYDQYVANQKKTHKIQHRSASIKCNGDLIQNSQCFYFDFRGRPAESLGNYIDTPLDYRNGVLQILANEDEISWLLNPKS